MITVPFGAFDILMLILRCAIAYGGEVRIIVTMSDSQDDIGKLRAFLNASDFAITSETPTHVDVKHEGNAGYKRFFEREYVGHPRI